MLAVIVLGSFAIAIQGRFSFAIVDATDGRRSALPYRFGTSKMYYDCNWRARFATDSPLEEADSNPRSPGPQRRTPYHPVKPFAARRDHRPPSTSSPTAQTDPDRVKTRTPGRQFTNFSRFSAFSAITGSAERKNSLQMHRFQTISEFSHSLDPKRPFACLIRSPH